MGEGTTVVGDEDPPDGAEALNVDLVDPVIVDFLLGRSFIRV